FTGGAIQLEKEKDWAGRARVQRRADGLRVVRIGRPDDAVLGSDGARLDPPGGAFGGADVRIVGRGDRGREHERESDNGTSNHGIPRPQITKPRRTGRIKPPRSQSPQRKTR